MNLSGSSYVRVAAVGGEVLEGAGLVEVARRAHALVDNGARLEAIGEYDVRVHGAHVQVVQNRRLQAIRRRLDSFSMISMHNSSKFVTMLSGMCSSISIARCIVRFTSSISS